MSVDLLRRRAKGCRKWGKNLFQGGLKMNFGYDNVFMVKSAVCGAKTRSKLLQGL